MTRPISRLHPSDDEDPTGVQQLLATLPDPGPMPADLVDRITASLAVEQAHRSPSSATTSPVSPVSPAPPVPPASAHPSSGPTEATVHALPRGGSSRGPGGPARRAGNASRGWLLGLSGAAAAVAIGGVAALNMLGPSGGHAGGGSLAFGHFPIDSVTSGVEPGQGQQALLDPGAGKPQGGLDAASPSTSASTGASSGTPARATTHIQMSNLSYEASTLTAQAAQLWKAPKAALPSLSAESPAIGPIGTPLGVTQCLDSLGVAPGRTVVDIARFDGAPAAIVVTDGTRGPQVRVVSRECGAPSGTKAVLAGPIALP